jgi:dihydropteroate synthase
LTTRSETFHLVLERSRARRGVALMGVCNVTPDSFSDGGMYLTLERACARVDELVSNGADFIDIGAESTRPGATPVGPDEQLGRMLGVVGYAAGRAPVTVDTTSPPVAAACLEAGAVAVNDVSCLADPAMADVAAAARASFILMHSRGPQSHMKGFSEYPDDAYGDVLQDVVREWLAAAERAMTRGLPRASLVMDPGLGFAKNAAQSAELLRRTGELGRATGAPVLIGASRKSFLTLVDEGASPQERIGASLAAALHAARAGASVLRVHDVRATRQAIDLTRLMDARVDEVRDV